MSKAKELAEQMFPEPQMENYDDILEYRNDRDWTFIARGAFVKGYEQAKEEMMKDAVEADIVESFTPVSESPNIYMHGFTCVYEEKESTPYVVAPCKVKLIIIKE